MATAKGHEGHGHGHGHGAAGQHAAAAPGGWTGAYLSALGMSAISFVGVVLLGVLDVPSVGPVASYTCLAFAGVVLVADALVHLLPHALEGADHGEMVSTGLAAVAGCLSLLVVQEVCEWHRHSHNHGIQAYGIANLVVEMLHNYVDGITIGLSWMAGRGAGLGATLAVAAHELPQELGDFVVLRQAGFPVPRLLIWNFIASLTCVLGVATAQFIGQEATMHAQRYLMAFTGGSFLCLALNMVFPQVMTCIAQHHKGAAVVRAKVWCLLVAGVAIYVLCKVGELESHGHGDGHGHGEAGHGHGHGSGRAEM